MDLRTRETDLSDRFQQWLRCVAVANFALLRIWTELLTPTGVRDFEIQLTPERYWAALALTYLFGTGLFLAWRSSRLLWQAAVLVTGLIVAKALFYAASNAGLFSRGHLYKWLALPAGQAILGLTVVCGCWLAYRFLRDGGPPLRPLATALVPFAFVVQANGVWRSLQPQGPAPVLQSEGPARAGAPGGPGRPRAVWIILDELDERIAFSQRPAGVELPHLDRFRREAAFVAKQAISPANATMASIPALLSGRLHDGLPALPESFTRVQQAGVRVGVTGWALPYCGTIRNLSSCECAPMNWQSNSYGTGFFQILRSQARSLFETNVFSPFGQSLTTKGHLATIRRLEHAAARMAARDDLDLVYIHLPAPHAPFVFNRETGKPDRWSWVKKDGYLDNLVFADLIFASIRAEMERQGVWEQSVVLVTADHGYRQPGLLGFPPDDLHVPFMLKTRPGQTVPLDPDAPLQTIETGKILARLLGLTIS